MPLPASILLLGVPLGAGLGPGLDWIFSAVYLQMALVSSVRSLQKSFSVNFFVPHHEDAVPASPPASMTSSSAASSSSLLLFLVVVAARFGAETALGGTVVVVDEDDAAANARAPSVDRFLGTAGLLELHVPEPFEVACVPPPCKPCRDDLAEGLEPLGKLGLTQLVRQVLDKYGLEICLVRPRRPGLDEWDDDSQQTVPVLSRNDNNRLWGERVDWRDKEKKKKTTPAKCSFEAQTEHKMQPSPACCHAR